MLLLERTFYSKASPKVIWSVLTDLGNWPKWNEKILSSSVVAPINSDTKGEFKLKNKKSYKFLVSQYEDAKKYFLVFSLPLSAKLVVKVMMNFEGLETSVTIKAELNGYSEFFYQFFYGNYLKELVSYSADKLKNKLDSF